MYTCVLYIYIYMYQIVCTEILNVSRTLLHILQRVQHARGTGGVVRGVGEGGLRAHANNDSLGLDELLGASLAGGSDESRESVIAEKRTNEPSGPMLYTDGC